MADAVVVLNLSRRGPEAAKSSRSNDNKSVISNSLPTYHSPSCPQSVSAILFSSAKVVFFADLVVLLEASGIIRGARKKIMYADSKPEAAWT